MATVPTGSAVDYSTYGYSRGGTPEPGGTHREADMELRADIGTPLRQARRERGLTLRAAADELDVPVDVLADLEAGRIDAFGPQLHASAYARVYARYLGIDEHVVLRGAEPLPPDHVAVQAPEVVQRRRLLLGVGAVLVGVGAVAAIAITLLGSNGDETRIDLTDGDAATLADAGVDEDDTGVLSRRIEPDPPEPDAGSGDPTPHGGPSPHTPAGEAPTDDTGADGDAAGDSEPPRDEEPIGEGVSVQILDGVGDARRVASARQRLLDLGYTVVFMDRAAGNYRRTTILHDPEHADAAAALVAADDRFTTTGDDPGLGAPAQLHVIVGADWPTG